MSFTFDDVLQLRVAAGGFGYFSAVAREGGETPTIVISSPEMGVVADGAIAHVVGTARIVHDTLFVKPKDISVLKAEDPRTQRVLPVEELEAAVVDIVDSLSFDGEADLPRSGQSGRPSVWDGVCAMLKCFRPDYETAASDESETKF